MSLEGYNLQTSVRYRVNPKLPCSVEYQLPSLRWQQIELCKTPEAARALLAKLTAEPQQEAHRD